MAQKDSLWDLAVNKNLETDFTNSGEKTLIFVGSKGSGKSTIIQRFLDRNDVIKETLALEYSFGRKSGRSLTKETCHVWELGDELLYMNLLDLHLGKKNTTLILVLDLSVPEKLWKTMEGLLTYVYNFHKKRELDTVEENQKEHEANVVPFPMPLLIIGGKYDAFQAFEFEKKKLICKTLRCLAHSLHASIIFYSDKDAVLIKKLKDVLHFHGFGGSQWKGHCSDYNKPLMICAGNDTYEEIGLNVNSLPGKARGLPLEIFKHTYTMVFPQVSEITSIPDDPVKDQSFKEPLIDSLRALKDEELDRFLMEKDQRRNMTTSLLF